MSQEELKKSDYLRVGLGVLLLLVALVFMLSSGGGAERTSEGSSISEGIEAIASVSSKGGIGRQLGSGLVSRVDGDINQTLKEVQGRKHKKEPVVPETDLFEEVRSDDDLDTKAMQRLKVRLQGPGELPPEDSDDISKLEKKSIIVGQGVKLDETEATDGSSEFVETQKLFARKIKETERILNSGNEERIKKLTELIVLLDNKDDYISSEAAVLIRRFIQPKDLNVLLEALRFSPSERARSHIFEVISMIATADSKAVVSALKFELQHAEEPDVPYIARALGETKSDKALSLLSGIISSGKHSEESKFAALISMGRVQSKRAGQAINSMSKYLSIFGGGGRAKTVDMIIERSKDQLYSRIDLDKVDQDFPPGNITKGNYKGSKFLFYNPSRIGLEGKKPWLFVCLHSERLRYRNTFQWCQAAAKKGRNAALTVFLDPALFPDFRNLDYRNISGIRSDERMWEIIDHLGKVADIHVGNAYFFGERAGGALLLRMAMLRPERIGRAMAWTADLPSLKGEKLFPFGSKDSPFFAGTDINIRGLPGVDLAICGADNQKNTEKFLDTLKEQANKEGKNFRLKNCLEGVSASMDHFFSPRKKALRYIFDYS